MSQPAKTLLAGALALVLVLVAVPSLGRVLLPRPCIGIANGFVIIDDRDQDIL